MFRPVSSKPDFVAQEHAILDEWRDRRTFARLRARNAGGPKWSFLDGPITANNPMGVHHAWGRAYKDLYQRFHAMLGEDERYQNGFDCQGLWVEVNVERDLGFTSQARHRGVRDRRVRHAVQAARPDLRRAPDRAVGPARDVDGLERPARAAPAGATCSARTRPRSRRSRARRVPSPTPSRCSSGGSGMPDTGGSYFTFSNENNDLIWGFLAECHRRGWLYKGHDTMPWCARCGTGISQTEMNEGYQDRDDPGLTVRFPLLDRPGESAARLDDHAVDADLERGGRGRSGPPLRPGPPGRRDVLAGQGHAQDGARGAVRGARGDRRAATWSAGATRGRSTSCRRSGRRSRATRRPGHAVRASGRGLDEVGEDEGTGIVHIAPGCGAEDFQLGKSLGLPVVAPLDESGIFLDGFGALSGRDVRDVAEPIVEHLRREGRFYRLETINHRYPHCWRCGTPLVFRLVDEWFISMGPVYDQPRETLTAEQVDASLRYQIMDVVDQIRWIPDFGYERELDWLRNMHDWMISKKRYWGLALPIYDCARVRDGRGHRRPRRAARAGRRGLGRVRGPHAAPALGRRGQDRLPGLRRTGRADHATSATRGSTPGSCRSRRSTTARIPTTGGSGSRPTSSPRASPASSATGSTRCSRCRRSCAASRRSGRSSATPSLFAEDGRADAQELRATRSSSTRRPTGWASTSCAGCSPRPGPRRTSLFGWHAADEARRELLVLWNVYAFFVTYARLAGWTPGRGRRRRSPSGRSSIAGSCRAPPAPRPRSRSGCATTTPSARRGRCPAISTACRPGTCACRAGGSRGRTIRRDRDAAFATLHEALVASAPDAGADPAVPGRSAVRQPGARTVLPDAPDSVHLTRWPTRRPGRPSRRRPGGSMAIAQGAVDLAADAAQHGAPQDAPAAGDGVAGPARTAAWPIDAGPARAHRRRDQRQAGRRHRRRFGARRAAGQAAPAADRQAPRVGDPRGHGRRPGRRGDVRGGRVGRRSAGVTPGTRRGRDPGDAAAGDRGRASTTAWSWSSTPS